MSLHNVEWHNLVFDIHLVCVVIIFKDLQFVPYLFYFSGPLNVQCLIFEYFRLLSIPWCTRIWLFIVIWFHCIQMVTDYINSEASLDRKFLWNSETIILTIFYWSMLLASIDEQLLELLSVVIKIDLAHNGDQRNGTLGFSSFHFLDNLYST